MKAEDYLFAGPRHRWAAGARVHMSWTLLAAALAAAGGTVATLKGAAAAAAFVALAGGGLLLFALMRPDASVALGFIAMVVGQSAALDLLRRVSVLPSVTLSGALTAVMALVGALVLIPLKVPRSAWRIVTPLLGLLALGSIGFLRAGVSIEGMQSVLTLLLFAECLVISLTAVWANPNAGPRVQSLVVGISAAASCLFLLATVLHVSEAWMPGARGIAAYLTLPLAWTSVSRGRGHRLATMMLLATIVVTLSRTAIAAALLVYFAGAIGLRRISDWPRLIAVLCAVVGVYLTLVLAIPALKDRFVAGDVKPVVGSVSLNVMGRSEVWRLVWRSALTAPVFGHGPGSAQVLVEGTVGSVGHPHNDFLRLFHDYGLTGLVLWIAFCLRAFRWLGALPREVFSDTPSGRNAAFLAVLGILVLMLTDNVLAYPFIMSPLGLMLGVGIGERMTGSLTGAHRSTHLPFAYRTRWQSP